MDATDFAVGGGLQTRARACCPAWCATGHGVHLGEEDWVHLSEPLTLTEGVTAQLCMSIDPATCAQDGPHVLIGSTEYTLAEAHALAASLMTLAANGGQTSTMSAI